MQDQHRRIIDARRRQCRVYNINGHEVHDRSTPMTPEQSLRARLFARAWSRDGRDIRPLPGRTWETSYTVEYGYTYLWYNAGHTTHVSTNRPRPVIQIAVGVN